MNRFNTRSVGSIYPPPKKTKQINKPKNKQTNPLNVLTWKKRNKCASNKHFKAFLSFKTINVMY